MSFKTASQAPDASQQSPNQGRSDLPAAQNANVPSLRLNFWWMLMGNAIYAACQWGVLGVFAHLQSAATLGELILALSVTAPVMAFFLLQMRIVQATDTKRVFDFGHFLALRLLALTAALITIAAISLYCGYGPRSLCMIGGVALLSTADGLSDVAYGLLQRHERLRQISQSLILRALLGLATIGLVLQLTGNPFAAIGAGAVARLLVVFAFDWKNVRQVLSNQAENSTPRWEPQQLWSLVRLAMPLGAVMMLIVLNNNIPRYFVERHLDHSSLGIFGAIGYLAVTGMTVVGALGESITPRLARAYGQTDKTEFLRLYFRLVKIAIGLGLVSIVLSLVAGPQILRFLYGPEYASRGRLLIWVAATAAVGYVASFSGYAITAARFFRSQLPLFAIVAITNAAACHWFVPRMGLDGAALAGLIAITVQLVGSLLILVYGLNARNVASITARQPSIETLPETA